MPTGTRESGRTSVAMGAQSTLVPHYTTTTTTCGRPARLKSQRLEPRAADTDAPLPEHGSDSHRGPDSGQAASPPLSREGDQDGGEHGGRVPHEISPALGKPPPVGYHVRRGGRRPLPCYISSSCLFAREGKRRDSSSKLRKMRISLSERHG